ncbi:hypothetical protein E0Z06_01055 [Rheinheimera sp. D18]|uniref:hypothetical protein n=1 Tax=Rheinheimera sp. D18 TaxID=2545632 RepID=UPI00104B0979|nr:hypothetical protein [Rheinheimera sp. D18]QBL08198.1 hypothetical protein E0Z06_01055 [Rheinheimera sp. D18]
MQHLRDLKYWSKGLAIFLWSLYLTVYLFLFKQIEPEETNNLKTFIGLAISVLIGGTWWNFITNLYNTPRNYYDHKYFFAALSALLILGSAIWVLSLFPLYNGSDKELYTKFTAAFVLVHMACIFIVPTWMMTRK